MLPRPRRLAGWLRMGAVVALVTLGGCGENEAPDDETNPLRAEEIARIVPASEAISGSQISMLDPATMNDAEIRKALGGGPRCEYQYTSAGRPVLALKTTSGGAAAEGVVKLNGNLVLLQATPMDGGVVLAADRVRMALPAGPDARAWEGGGELQEAEFVFEIDGSLRVGYGGYYRCVE